MLNLDADQKEIDLADNNVLQVVSINRKDILLDVWFDALLSKHEKAMQTKVLAVPGFVVFELDVKAVLDSDLHLNRVVAIWGHDIRVHPDVLLLDYISHSTQNRNSYKVSTLFAGKTNIRVVN